MRIEDSQSLIGIALSVVGMLVFFILTYVLEIMQ